MISIRRNGLCDHPLANVQLKVLESALAAIDPEQLLLDQLTIEGDSLCVGNHAIPLDHQRIWILSIGKAGVPMAQAVEAVLGPKRVAGGVAVTRTGYGGRTKCVRVIEAGHPLPRGTDGADAVLEIARNVARDDLVLCLLSGGGSALLASPPAGIRLAEIAHTTELLLHSGVPIDEMNTVRRHISQLQGGQLMKLLSPATVLTLVLSDVIGDRLESIASGPTVPDPTSFADAVAVLQKASLFERVPASIRDHLVSGMASHVLETPKPRDPIFQTSYVHLLANNATAVAALGSAARAAGFAVHSHTSPLTGEARDNGLQLADQAAALANRSLKKWALIAGGETTVTLHGDGIGGRNQELALAAALRLDGVDGISFAAMATDGTDGPTDAAGALIDGYTAERARQRGIDPSSALDRNDSHRLLALTGDLLWTGPTRTNVADLVLVLGDPTA